MENRISMECMEKNRLRVARYPGFLMAVILAFAFLVTFNCSTAFAWYVAGQGWLYTVFPPPSPKIPQDFDTYYEYPPVSCIEAFTMKTLDCPFTISIAEDTSVNGGHTHSRMVSMQGIGTLSGIGLTQFSPWEVRGQTAQLFSLKYEHPEMSGGVILKGVVLAAPGHVCLPDGTLAACTIIYHIDFQVRGLVPLPPSAAGEYTFSGIPLSDGTPNYHTDNHFGTPKLVAAITKVARNFKRDTGISLGINDMSLPWGGLYDYHSTGYSPHKGHRKGTSVDIDSIDPVFQLKLTKGFSNQDCYKVEEATIHYECK